EGDDRGLVLQRVGAGLDQQVVRVGNGRRVAERVRVRLRQIEVCLRIGTEAGNARAYPVLSRGRDTGEAIGEIGAGHVAADGRRQLAAGERPFGRVGIELASSEYVVEQVIGQGELVVLVGQAELAEGSRRQRSRSLVVEIERARVLDEAQRLRAIADPLIGKRLDLAQPKAPQVLNGRELRAVYPGKLARSGLPDLRQAIAV